MSLQLKFSCILSSLPHCQPEEGNVPWRRQILFSLEADGRFHLWKGVSTEREVVTWFKIENVPGGMEHTCDHSTQKEEAGGSGVQGQS